MRANRSPRLRVRATLGGLLSVAMVAGLVLAAVPAQAGTKAPTIVDQDSGTGTYVGFSGDRVRISGHMSKSFPLVLFFDALQLPWESPVSGICPASPGPGNAPGTFNYATAPAPIFPVNGNFDVCIIAPALQGGLHTITVAMANKPRQKLQGIFVLLPKLWALPTGLESPYPTCALVGTSFGTSEQVNVQEIVGPPVFFTEATTSTFISGQFVVVELLTLFSVPTLFNPEDSVNATGQASHLSAQYYPTAIPALGPAAKGPTGFDNYCTVL